MAKRSKKSTSNGEVLVYFGILISIIVIIGVVYLASSTKKESVSFKAIDNIDRYFEGKKRDYTILDKPKNIDENQTQNDIKFNEKIEPPTTINSIDLKSDKPNLAIIIDDISTFYQAKKIKSLDMNITPSIFPPSKNYPNSANVAKDFEFYMIHLPLEAMNYQAQEKDTLKVGDNIAKIEAQIYKIRSNFPNAIYINNHTGSKFTSDYNSMKNLFKTLKKHNMIFIDSYTTKDSKAKILSDEFGNKYLKRDVFIDNIKDEKAIISKLKESIKIAKKNGFAIAIGHPYEQTFKALKAIKSELESQTRLILLKDMYELYH